MDLTHLLLTLILILAGAKIFGELANRVGQPPVLGELVAGIVLGVSCLKIVNPDAEVIVFLADVGVIILLFEIGLATDPRELWGAGGQSLAVALVGLALPFAGGYFLTLAFGYKTHVAVFVGAALAATGVAVVARVLGDLGALKTKEGTVILGAGVIDDIIGLIILAVVRGLATGGEVSAATLARVTALSAGFFVAALVLGGVFARRLVWLIEKTRVRGALIVAAVGFALLWAFGASVVGTAPFVGAFAAGLALGRTRKYDAVAADLKPVADIFTPIFFVKIGAGVILYYLNPFEAAYRPVLFLAGLLFGIAMLGKVAAGYAAWGRGVNRLAVGVGMSPRGVVGLIFVDAGRRAGIVTDDLFGALLLVIAATTFVGVPLMKLAFGRRPGDKIPPPSSTIIGTSAPAKHNAA